MWPPPPPPEAACTSIEKSGRDALKVPSVTLITILEKRWAAAPDGAVPESSPVRVLKFAQDGAFRMLKVSALPSGSPAVGVNAYWPPAATVVAGVPEMVGA